MSKIKVIVVDDSALMRKIISDMLNEESDIEVIDIARNGEELLSKLEKHRPDAITLDVEMPKMDGITALKELKRKNIHIPVIMLSSISTKGTELTMECLEAGAFDFIPKPSGTISLDINKVRNDLIEKIRAAYNKSSAQVNRNFNKFEKRTQSLKEEREAKREALRKRKEAETDALGKIDAVVIGASTGGPKALYTVVTALPVNLGVPVIIVQHMPAGFTKAFAERLNNNSDIKVVEAFDGQNIEKNVVYIAPGGFHLEVGGDGKLHLNTEPTIWGVRPAVDKLFISASKIYGSRLMSVVLTGMGRDGAGGTVEVKSRGGFTLSEDESTCTIYGMPKAAYETGKVDLVLPLEEIPVHIVKTVMGVRR
ncbi:protein-glutamate methylesterase/protein-glutamine glutaminase [Clostridium amazonitimonense]|uniref:protein-glutamate methylesterase/protein-glutamine glutaminase n=1 Tax=Clostridium amazonitimonense TaxID=1499689 RepID=UPI0005096929|nr:chemotaxis response regulator protein-glutamate methylesterase [Clostridium amazonitimonense]